jgi:hypothetical protein
MRTHVRFLAALEIAFGIIGTLCGIGALLLFGSIVAFVEWQEGSSGGALTTPILGGAGMIAFLILILLSLPQLAAGIGLWQEREWGRILSLVVCALNLVNVPFGTALGIYGLWVLLSGEGKAYFDRLEGRGGGLPASRMQA